MRVLCQSEAYEGEAFKFSAKKNSPRKCENLNQFRPANCRKSFLGPRKFRSQVLARRILSREANSNTNSHQNQSLQDTFSNMEISENDIPRSANENEDHPAENPQRVSGESENSDSMAASGRWPVLSGRAMVTLILMSLLTVTVQACRYSTIDARHTMCSFMPKQCPGKMLMRKYILETI